MDMQKSAASRVRHILAAMERSIDTARSRRVNTGSDALSGASDMPAPLATAPATPTRNGGSFAAGTQRFSSTPAPVASAPSKSNQMIGASPLIGGRVGDKIGGNGVNPTTPMPAADPSAPPRLKAKPKRFEGTFAAQFNQPNYRSQAG